MSTKPTAADIDATVKYLKLRDEVYALAHDAKYDTEKKERAKTLLELAKVEAMRTSPGAIRLTQLTAEEHQLGIDEENRTRIFRRWVRFGVLGLPIGDRQILERARVQFTDEELRAQGVGTGAAGGFTAPDDEMLAFQEVLKDFSAMRKTASVISTRRGTDAPFPSADETLIEGEMVAESGTITEQDVVFSEVVLKAFKFSSKIVRVSGEWLQDAQDGPAVIRRLLGGRIARIQNKKFTIGVGGTTEPAGIVGAATLGKTGIAGQTTTVIYDDFVDLIHSVDAAYRGNAIFQMNDATLKTIRRLKDSAGQPIVTQPPGARDSILGYPVIPNNDVPIMAASAKSILFGDFSQYQIRDVAQLVLLRLIERYAEFGQVGFIALLRSDGRLLIPAAVRYYQNAAS